MFWFRFAMDFVKNTSWGKVLAAFGFNRASNRDKKYGRVPLSLAATQSANPDFPRAPGLPMEPGQPPLPPTGP
jgi:hypothetical protein